MEQENTPTTGGTIKFIEEKCQELKSLYDDHDMLKAQLSSLNETIANKEKEIETFLQTEDLTSYKSKMGTVYMITRSSVSVPKGEAKQAFFGYLKEQGIYDEVVTVNSQWLNGFYKKEIEAATERGELVAEIPGIESPKLSTTLGFRKA